MKKWVILLFSSSIILLGFGYWGLFSESAKKYFDEMDGMIPFFSLVVGIITTLITAVLYFFQNRK